ncbi:hypothetical protein DMB66_38610 [Actinoplanes sp. ATCC 53533]|uniref:IPT/TIG domain-containing protein n=1 Tax=Actinoplanes sp. ATCC 53533 TaxID=1288362 RepID=UPI000F778F81|nr:IPT/TIG domain-containing protein [Actinoplanes sp. ATCC 53533]RSM53718.1 hypothetical protein DMB66_38610 [Actinoplanes sp. ATCC 53533]
MPALPASPRNGVLRPWGAGTAAVLLGVGLAVAPAAPARATAVCASATPALDTQVTCTSAGTQDVTVPAGATAVHLKVTGGGGGGSRAADGWASGGKGAVTSGWATLPLGTSFLRIKVGAGGAGGVAGTDDSLGGGGGGGGSGVFAYSATSVMLGTLVITGGGGGAGGQDTSTTVTGGGAGGNAGAAGTGYGSAYSANGGAAASGVNGGAGGSGDYAGTAGGGAMWGAIASGGIGASIGTRRAGNGGGGYSGGGGGGAQDLALAGAGSVGSVMTLTTQYLGGGGGGGGNYTNTGAMPARWFGHAGGTGAGSGGTGLAAGDPTTMPDGGTGAVEATFVEVVPTPAITSISPTTGLPSGGGTLTITGTDLEGTQAVMVGAMACGSVVVVSPTQVTCTIPMSALAIPVSVQVVSPRGVSPLFSSYTYAAAPTVTSVSPTSGPLAGGTTLTITGTNLLGTNSVTVGSDACTSVVVQSATEVTCTLPEKLEAGAFDVVATNPIASGTKLAAYEYVETPTVTSISPVTGLLAGGGTLTITGTLLTDTSAVSLGGTACTTIANVSATEVTCTIPSRLTTGTVGLELTATAGTASLASAYEYTQPAPTIDSVSPISGRLSGGGTLTITGTNLSLTSSVMLEETACTTIVNVSPTQVTCTIPAGTALGPVQVNVTTAGGFVGAAGAYTYVATATAPPPVMTPTTAPTLEPTPEPTVEPTLEPTPEPTAEPTPTGTPAPGPDARRPLPGLRRPRPRPRRRHPARPRACS